MIIRVLITITLSAVAFSSCSHHSISTRNPAQDNGDIVIVTTTDFHAALDQAESLAEETTKLRERFGNRMLYLDAGDIFQGSLEGNLNKGKSLVSLYNLLGVDAASMGNHELDYGPKAPHRMSVNLNEDGLGNLRIRKKEAKFQWLSSNFEIEKGSCNPLHDHQCNALGKKTFFKPHAVITKNNLNTCIIGATTPQTATITNTLFIRGMRFERLEKILPAEVDFLNTHEHCDFKILLVHAGLMCNHNGRCLERGELAEILPLLETLPPHTFDAVVAGHTHLLAQETINGTPVIEAGARGNDIGILHLYKDPNKKAEFEPWVKISDHPQNTESNLVKNVKKLLSPYREEAGLVKKRIIAESTSDFTYDYNKENALGNAIASSLLEYGNYKANFALANAGGIRNNLKAGSITFGNIYDVLPFDNSYAYVDLYGSELRTVLEIAYSGVKGSPSFAGGTIVRKNIESGKDDAWTRDLNGDGKNEDWERNILINVLDKNGDPIDDKKIYRLATISFLLDGAERQDTVYNKIPDSRKHRFPTTWVRDVFESYLRTLHVIDASMFYDKEQPRIIIQ